MPDIPWSAKVPGPASLRGKACRAALFVGLAVFGCLAWSFLYPPAQGTDSLIYHLTLPAHWLHHGYLSPLDLPFHDGAAQHSPQLSGTITWLLMLLTGDGGLAWTVQPVFLLLALWAFHRSARLAGLARPPAAAAAGLLVLYPAFLNSSMIANNELIMTAGFALTGLGMMSMRRRPGPALLIGAAGVALMLATKVVGVVHSATALPLLLLLFALRLRQGPKGALRRAWPWAAGAAGLIAAGSFFLLRNWAIHGNPLYPAVLRVAGAEVFPGLYDYSVLARGWPDWRMLVKVLFHSGEQTFGPTWRFSVLLWGGLLVNLGLLATRRGRRARRWPLLAAGVVFPVVTVLIHLKFVPFRGHQRLIFPVYYALFLGFAGALAELARLRKPLAGRLVGWGLPALVALNFAALHAWLIKGSVVAGLIGVGLALAGRPNRRLARRLKLAAVGLLVLAAACGPLWYPAYRRARAERRQRVYSRGIQYGGEEKCWALLQEIGARRPPLTVAYSGTPHVYPLFGVRLANRAVYVPVGPDDRPQPTRLHFGEGVHLYLDAKRRARLDEEYWLAGLRREEVDYLVLVEDPRLGGGVRKELAAMKRHPESFKEVFAEKGAHLVRFLRR